MIHHDRRQLEIDLLRHLAHHPAEIIDWIHPRLFLYDDTTACARWLEWAAVTDDLSGEVPPDLTLRVTSLPAPGGDPFAALLHLLHEAATDLEDLLHWEVANFQDDPYAADNLAWVSRLIEHLDGGDLDAARLLLVALRFAHREPPVQ